MRSFVSMLARHAGGWSVMALASAGGVRAIAADDFAVVNAFAVSGDLDPIGASAPAATRAVRKSAVTRATLPAIQPAAASTGSAAGKAFFANSKSVVPLLVADLEPAAVPVSRPMAGRSVGARPSAPRSMTSAAR